MSASNWKTVCNAMNPGDDGELICAAVNLIYFNKI